MAEQQIKVYARVRPCFDTASDYQGIVVDELDRNRLRFEVPSTQSVSSSNATQEHYFPYERVFWKDSTQEDIYNTVAKPMIQSTLEGFNCTLFAYGQTGSGKTFTITGDGTPQAAGIVPRAINDIYQSGDQSISISYLEIYNNTAYDLLSSPNTKQMQKLEDLQKVMIVDNGRKTIFKDLNEAAAPTFEDAHRLFWFGERSRQKAATVNNKYSSRSHTIFTFHIKRQIGEHVTMSKINFVDLAGSEKFESLNGEIDQRKLEARHINKSLHTLQQVIIGITQHKSHVPFRDSALTRFLKDSLTGNCRTSMIATISTKKDHVIESLSTCRFGESVASVTTMAKKNTGDISPQEMIERLRKEISVLREELDNSGGRSGDSPPSSRVTRAITETQAMSIQDKVVDFVEDKTEVLNVSDPGQVQFCFQFMKDLIKRGNSAALRVSQLQQRLDESERNVATYVKLMNTRQQNRASGDTVISKEAAYLEFCSSHEKWEVCQKLRESLKKRVQDAKVLNQTLADLRQKRDELHAQTEKIETAEEVTESQIMNTEDPEERQRLEYELEGIQTEADLIAPRLEKTSDTFNQTYEELKSCSEVILGLQRELNHTRANIQADFENFWLNTVMSHTKGKISTPKTPKIRSAAYSTLNPSTKP